jgi:hypothetical protein
LGGTLLGGRGPLLGLGDQLLGGALRRGQPLGLLPLRLLAAGRKLDVELGLGLGPLSLALLQDPLRLAPHLVSLALGGGEDLVPLPLRGRLQLGDLALSGGAQLGDVPLDRGALLRHLVVGGGPQLGHLALGGRGQLVGLAAGHWSGSRRLRARRGAQVLGLAAWRWRGARQPRSRPVARTSAASTLALALISFAADLASCRISFCCSSASRRSCSIRDPRPE